MEKHTQRSLRLGMLAGDAFTLGFVTLVGFASHGEIGTAGGRFWATFVPLLAGWLLIAPHLGAFDVEQAADWRRLWRPFWAMVLAGPLAAWLRGVWLNTPIIPIFVVVLGGFSAAGLLIWRALFSIWLGRGFRLNWAGKPG